MKWQPKTMVAATSTQPQMAQGRQIKPAMKPEKRTQKMMVDTIEVQDEEDSQDDPWAYTKEEGKTKGMKK